MTADEFAAVTRKKILEADIDTLRQIAAWLQPGPWEHDWERPWKEPQCVRCGDFECTTSHMSCPVPPPVTASIYELAFTWRDRCRQSHLYAAWTLAVIECGAGHSSVSPPIDWFRAAVLTLWEARQ